MGSEPLRSQTLTTIGKILKKYNCLENHYRNISIVHGMNPYRDIQIHATHEVFIFVRLNLNLTMIIHEKYNYISVADSLQTCLF
jgi:hypothetical protein